MNYTSITSSVESRVKNKISAKMKVILISCAIFCAFAAVAKVEGGVIPSAQELLEIKLSNKEPLDSEKKYWMSWSIHEASKVIVFEVEAVTTGYVGLGISPNGGMTKADIFIAGVKNGQAYSGDYHGTENGMPTLDKQQDWTLLAAEENSTHTRLRFSRLLDTCDKEGDLPITLDTARVIWAMGDKDDLGYHGKDRRGSVSYNFLLPDMPFNPSQYQHFDIMNELEMPAQDTTYWCTIHKGPELDKKHHIVGFDANLNNPDAQAYTHHAILFRCRAPKGVDPDVYFGKHVGTPGEICYLPSGDQKIPFEDCQNQFIAWAKGGKTTVFPDETGLPIGETTETQYYMMEVHYDNPAIDSGKKFETGLRTYYTDKLREFDAGLLEVEHRYDFSLLVPPNTTNYIVAGHCPAECTENIPKKGLTVFNNLLHAHTSARKMKVRQFRNGVELPWLDNDEAYDFNFQQNKAFAEYKYILPGDHLTVECTYDSTWHPNKEIIAGGLTSKDEMCQGAMYYYPAAPGMGSCNSGLPLKTSFNQMGITKYRLVNEKGFERYYIDEPEHLKGSFIESASNNIKWTDEFKKEFEKQHRFGTHLVRCGEAENEGEYTLASYPYIKQEYVPEDKCKA